MQLTWMVTGTWTYYLDPTLGTISFGTRMMAAGVLQDMAFQDLAPFLDLFTRPI